MVRLLVLHGDELSDNGFELGQCAEIQVVANLETGVEEDHELFGIVLLLQDLFPEEMLFLLFLVVHLSAI